MRNRALRGCLIVVFAVCVILLENIGSVAKKRIKTQPNAQQSQQQPEADKRGTIDAPFVVKPLRTEKNQQEADEDARDKNEKRWNDRITIFVAVATAIILFFQLIVFGRQARRLKQTIEAMKKIGADQSKDMQGWIAVADKSADAALKSAFVAEQALYGTEAPFIFIIIAATDGNTIVTVTSPQGVEYPEHVSYMFHNYGRSPAIIREIYLVCIASEGVPSPCPFPPLQTNLFKSEIVGPGNSSKSEPLPQIASCLPNDGKSHQWASVFAYGLVRYADVFGNHYLSGFCYAFNAICNRFYAIGGANHNYRRKLTEDENREAEERDKG